MRLYCALFISLCPFITLNAREHRGWTYDQLNEAADLIVIAIPTKVQATPEKVSLPNIQRVLPRGRTEDVIGDGVETTFDVLTVLKGDRTAKALVLRHFNVHGAVADGPERVSFDPKKKHLYLMFLKKEADGRYAAVSGQTDPAFAIKELPDSYP